MPFDHPVARTLTLRRDGLELSARHFGPDDAPLVILLHGFPDTPHTWDGLIPLLVEAGYQVLAPWLRGYTPGSASRAARYDLMAVSADAAAWHVELGGPSAHLVGHDWGAFVAMILAKQDPRRWESLTLLAIPPFGGGVAPGMWRYLPRQLVLSSYIPVMQSGLSPRLLTRRGAGFVRALWRRWSPGWAFTDDEFAPVAAVFTDPVMAWAATRYYRSLFTVQRRATRAFGDILMAEAAPLPTLALAGLRDGCMSPGLQRVLAEHAHVQHAQLPGCGHFLQAERPDAVAELLLPHLRAAGAHTG
ncbi:alpha/beta fold hydrolase [Nocardia sp. NPDC059229]|uniref:alpha/beta fold hydrolase n=1 Tax=Nocardia sp. NPDC059229 TaxID=3346778 RepID=UPI0036B4EADB